MSLSLNDIIGNIFHSDEKQKTTEEQNLTNLSQKANNIFGTGRKPYNPFLNKSGELVNPYIDYQGLLDSPNTATAIKDYIILATGLKPNEQPTYKKDTSNESITDKYESFKNEISYNDDTSQENSTYKAPPIKPVNTDNLASLDVATELPKLTAKQIESIIKKHFSNSTVISESDAQGIYDAQQKSGMSALAILGIGALESGWGTSNIAKQKNNLWGWNATNVNPMGNATTFSPVAQGAFEFANSYMKTYYNKYGAKSINSAGTGDNPAGKGYAYYDNGTINSQWATSIGQIMKSIYKTATAGN